MRFRGRLLSSRIIARVANVIACFECTGIDSFVDIGATASD